MDDQMMQNELGLDDCIIFHLNVSSLKVFVHPLSSLQWRSQHTSQLVSIESLLRYGEHIFFIFKQIKVYTSKIRSLRSSWIPAIIIEFVCVAGTHCYEDDSNMDISVGVPALDHQIIDCFRAPWRRRESLSFLQKSYSLQQSKYNVLVVMIMIK